MARAVSTRRTVVFTIAAWIVALVIFFPILYTIITSFKSETEAIQGFNLIPSGTVESYQAVQAQSNYFKFFLNSVIISVGSTLIALLISVPAAWSMAFSPTNRTKDILMWMLSTKMMPAAAVMVPIYLLFRDFGLLDSRFGLTAMLTMINLPIVVWMLYTYFREIPGEILEASRMDGASLWGEIWHVLTPMAVPGIASTMLLNIILAWNEALLDDPAHHHQCRTADSLHCLVLLTAGSVLGETVGRVDACDRADPDHGLVQPETTCPRPDLWRREVTHRKDLGGTHGQYHLKKVNKSFGATQVIPGIDLDDQRGRVRRLRRSLGLREVDAFAPDRRS